MIEHDPRFGVDGPRVFFYEGFQHALGTGCIELGIVFNRFIQLIVTTVGSIIGQYVKNKAFFDGLFHRIQVEWTETAVRIADAEAFQGRRLWGGSKGKIGSVSAHFTDFHGTDDQILRIDFTFLVYLYCAQHLVHLVGCMAALTAMGFVYDNPKAFISHGVNFVEDVREFLDRRDDNTSSRFQCGSQIAGGMGVGDDIFYFGKAPDVLFQLPVEDATVGDDNDGVEHGPVSVFDFNQLEGCPGNGVRFTGTGRM